MMDPTSSKGRSNSNTPPWTGLRQRRLPSVAQYYMLDHLSSIQTSSNSPWIGLRQAGLTNMIDNEEEPVTSIVRNLQTDNDSAPTDPPLSESTLCNEAKCLSTGLFPGGMFNCYGLGPNTLFPFICDDSWIGIEITSLDVATPKNPNLVYYTCYPSSTDNILGPDDMPISQQQDLQRHCLDPQLVDDDASDSDSDSDNVDISSICAKKYPSSYPYGRYMTLISGIPDAYMCCNNNDVDAEVGYGGGGYGSTTMVGDTYGDESFEPDENDRHSVPDNELNPVQLCYPTIWCASQSCTVTNSFFSLQRMNCANDVYRYPEVIKMTGNTGMYQCCSLEEYLWATTRRRRLISSTSTSTSTNNNNSTTTPVLNNGSFLMDTPAFNATIYTQFIMALIASLLFFTLIVAISVSLYKMKKKSTQQNNRYNYGRRTTTPDYSSYNLYLVFLFTPDLIYNIFTMVVVMKSDYNGWIPETNALVTICATINMYMNCIIAHEVMVLLRRTKNIQRYTPPSYKKASIQLFVVTIYAIILGLLWYFLIHVPAFTGTDDPTVSSEERCTVAIPWRQYSIPIFYILVVGIPLVYLCYVCFIIWKQELFPKDQVTVTVVPHRLSRLTNRIGDLFSRSRTTTTTTGTSDNNNDNTTISAIDSTKTEKDVNSNGYTPPIHGRSTYNSTTPAVNTGDDNSGNKNDVVSINDVVAKVATTSNNSTNDDDTTPHRQPTTITTTNTTPTTVTVAATTTTSTFVGGRLNILVMYFMRIILVFFFVWLPGMVMYYKAYETNRTSAGLLQNIGFLFFTLQAIVSCSMAMSKPDVRKAVYDLYDDTVRILFGGIVKSIKNRRQEKKEKEEQHQEQQGESSTSLRSSKYTKSTIGNDAVDIENGNDSNKSNHIDNDNNNHDTKEDDVSLPRMIEETEYDDVEAQSSSLTHSTNTTEKSDGSTTITTTTSLTTTSMLINEERHNNNGDHRNIDNRPPDPSQNGILLLLQSLVDQETNIIEDDEKKMKNHRKKKNKKHKDKTIDNSSPADNDENDDDAAHIIDDINDTVETKPPSSKKMKKKKDKNKDKKINNNSADYDDENDDATHIIDDINDTVKIKPLSSKKMMKKKKKKHKDTKINNTSADNNDENDEAVQIIDDVNGTVETKPPSSKRKKKKKTTITKDETK